MTLVALALGGATELPQQAVFTFAVGLLIFVAPPNRSLGPVANFLFTALFVLGLVAFLPASSSAWRENLVTHANLQLPDIRTPQPWLTIQACCLMFVGIVWSYYVLSQEWNSDKRKRATQLLVSGVAVLAAVAVAAYALGFHVPGWNQEQNRGWFPNRNQTADVLAVCAVINYTFVFDGLRKKQATATIWILTLIIIGAGLVVSYSRAGIIMFFGGIVLWHLLPTGHKEPRKKAFKWTTVSLTVVFSLLTLFFLFGGNTLERFEGRSLGQSVGDAGFRVAIQQDALRFSTQNPWFGVGLGNFEPLFAMAREASANAERAIHPESDWLWAACEMGWLAPLILLSGVFWWVTRCFPFQVRAGESLRRALTVAGILFILHGLVDVAGHRLGSLSVGMLVLSLALPNSEQIRRRSEQIPMIFRGLSLGLLLIGGWWLFSVNDLPALPTTASLAELQAKIGEARNGKDLPTVEKTANQALAIAPLDWQLYFQRAYAETFQPGELSRAGADFITVRTLEPKWVQPCYDEGVTWLAADQPDLCLDAWTEALRRAGPEDVHDLYHQMVAASTSNDLVHAGLLTLAGQRIDYLLIFLADATPDDTTKIVSAVLATDPTLKTLTLKQQEKFFDAWWAEGDRPSLLAGLAANPSWVPACWEPAAQSYADQKDFKRAWETATRYGPAPVIPEMRTHIPINELQQAFYRENDNLPAGIALYSKQVKMGDNEDALTTLHTVEKIKNCPAYVYYLEAQLWAGKGQWELAWDAWLNYRSAPAG